tara:strand:+ start:353 stop:898 length:546 start_codon:yes stop_codon:yes gene_type:complete
MATSISANPSVGITYTLTETNSDSTLSESTAVSNSITFANGTGTGQANYGASTTGFLPSGGKVVHDFTSFSKSVFGSTVNLNFTNIKGVVVTANWGGPSGTGIASGYPLIHMPYLNIASTGVNGFSGLFNGGSGNLKVTHEGSWSLVDFIGIPTASDSKEFTLIDSGSGIAYEMIVVGLTG